ncbi:MAG: DUF362 domain-containing protein, partial [Candidatus Omnitrophota bacterium]
MKSKVYFIPVIPGDNIQAINRKLARLLEASKLLDFIRENERVAIKIHFGEEGNTGFVDPAHARVICDAVIRKGAKALLSDANTLYRGRRLVSSEHLALAREHGFTREAVGADLVIPDDNRPEDKI